MIQHEITSDDDKATSIYGNNIASHMASQIYKSTSLVYSTLVLVVPAVYC